jgi:hypothetical protein
MKEGELAKEDAEAALELVHATLGGCLIRFIRRLPD